MTIDFNDAGPRWINPIEAQIDLEFERLFNQWICGLSGYFDRDEFYDVQDYRAAFLEYCANEFDRQIRRGPASYWPRKNHRDARSR